MNISKFVLSKGKKSGIIRGCRNCWLICNDHSGYISKDEEKELKRLYGRLLLWSEQRGTLWIRMLPIEISREVGLNTIGK